MSTMSKTVTTNSVGYSWLVLFIVGALLALSSLFILGAGVDQAEFQASAGISWADFASQQPGAATYLVRIIRLVGLVAFGFAFLGAAISFTAFRQGQFWAWVALWSLPAVYGLTAALMLGSGSSVGYFYAAVTLVALLSLLFSYRRFSAGLQE